MQETNEELIYYKNNDVCAGKICCPSVCPVPFLGLKKNNNTIFEKLIAEINVYSVLSISGI